MKRLLLAVQFLTRLPVPAVTASDTDFAASMRWFPAVGLLIGGGVAGAAWAGAHVDPWMGALAALVAWVLLTGALHLDGLADVADGCGAAHRDRARLLAAMTDPHVGSFGVVAIVLQLLAKLVLLHALVEQGLWLPLLLIPAAARIGPLAWTHWLPPLHPGLAARFAEAVDTRHLIGWAVLLLAGAALAPGVLAALLLIPAWALWLRRVIGGISGDGHGAGIELVESGLLLASLLAGRL